MMVPSSLISTVPFSATASTNVISSELGSESFSKTFTVIELSSATDAESELA